MSGLQPGNAYALSIRSLVHGDWTGWSRSIVVTTLEQLKVADVDRVSVRLRVGYSAGVTRLRSLTSVVCIRVGGVSAESGAPPGHSKGVAVV